MSTFPWMQGKAQRAAAGSWTPPGPADELRVRDSCLHSRLVRARAHSWAQLAAAGPGPWGRPSSWLPRGRPPPWAPRVHQRLRLWEQKQRRVLPQPVLGCHKTARGPKHHP